MTLNCLSRGWVRKGDRFHVSLATFTLRTQPPWPEPRCADYVARTHSSSQHPLLRCQQRPPDLCLCVRKPQRWLHSAPPVPEAPEGALPTEPTVPRPPKLAIINRNCCFMPLSLKWFARQQQKQWGERAFPGVAGQDPNAQPNLRIAVVRKLAEDSPWPRRGHCPDTFRGRPEELKRPAGTYARAHVTALGTEQAQGAPGKPGSALQGHSGLPAPPGSSTGLQLLRGGGAPPQALRNWRDHHTFRTRGWGHARLRRLKANTPTLLRSYRSHPCASHVKHWSFVKSLESKELSNFLMLSFFRKLSLKRNMEKQ